MSGCNAVATDYPSLAITSWILMKNLLRMHRIQEYYFTVESKNIPERCNRSFSLFTSCLIDLVYIIARKRMQILQGGVGVATKFVRRQFALCNRRGKNYSTRNVKRNVFASELTAKQSKCQRHTHNLFTTTHAQLRITEIKLLLRSPADLRLKWMYTRSI